MSSNKRKRNEACNYVRTHEDMSKAIKEFKEIHAKEAFLSGSALRPFLTSKDRVESSLSEGEISSSELLIRSKIDGSDKSFKEYIDKPSIFDSAEWHTTASDKIDEFESRIHEINICVPSVITIGNNVLNVTTSQAILSFYMATPCISDIDYTLSIKKKFYNEEFLSNARASYVQNKRTDLVEEMCKTRVGIKKDKFKKMHVLSVGTGCGKTMMAILSTALCIIDKGRWNELRMSFRSHHFEDTWSGAICNSHHEDQALVRCCLIFSPKNLTSQWSESVIGVCQSLIPHIKQYSSKVYVWSGRGDVYKIFMAKDLSKVHAVQLNSNCEDYPKKGNFNLKWFYENVQCKNKNSSLFWILPLCSDSINEIQSYPYLNYSCQIFDEYTNSTKKNNQFTRSVCFGPTIITQATLEGLSGCMGRDPHHPLRVAMNSSSIQKVSNLDDKCDYLVSKCFHPSGRLSVNCEISSLIHHMQAHSFQSLFITPYFLRRFLSFESQTMMMKGTDVYHVLFKNMTIQSQLGLIESDMYSSTPEEFSTSLINGVTIFSYPHYKSNVQSKKSSSTYRFQPYGGIGEGKPDDYEFTDVEYIMAMSKAKHDIEVLCKVDLYKDIAKFCREGEKWIESTRFLFCSTGKVSLVVNKMKDIFIGKGEKKILECPVCLTENVALKDIKMTSCCICNICDSCFRRCKICPNCRDPNGMKNNIDGSFFDPVETSAEEISEDSNTGPVTIPTDTQEAIRTLCYSYIKGKYAPKNLYDCFENSMKILLNYKKPRIIIYANYTAGMDFQGLNNTFSAIFGDSGRTGKVFDMEKMSGNIKRSAEALEAFHSPDESPVVWICSSIGTSQTFAGLDLYDLTGMIVCNANMSNHMIDQIIGRMTRMTTDQALHDKRVPIIHLISSHARN